MEFALVGLTSSGKTALFEALTGVEGTSTGHGAHHGILPVPDERVEKVAAVFSSRKCTHATIDLVDIPGLSPAGSQAAQYNDRILGDIREADALLFVVRTFGSDSVSHPLGSVNPARDLDTLISDLHVSDLGIIEHRLGRLETTIGKEPKDHREPHLAEQRVLTGIRESIDEGKKPDFSQVPEPDLQTIKGYGFFTLKPSVLVANVGDLTDEAERIAVESIRARAEKLGITVVAINAALEAELSEFPVGERADYYEAMGLPGPAAGELIRTVYSSLDLVTFLTANEKEARAWPLVRGSAAPEAAGVVHTDMQRGFIRAEVVAFDELARFGNVAEAKKHGKVQLEGKDYIVRDGDVIFFHFSR